VPVKLKFRGKVLFGRLAYSTPLGGIKVLSGPPPEALASTAAGPPRSLLRLPTSTMDDNDRIPHDLWLAVHDDLSRDQGSPNR
jgi:hypothetical protein